MFFTTGLTIEVSFPDGHCSSAHYFIGKVADVFYAVNAVLNWIFVYGMPSVTLVSLYCSVTRTLRRRNNQHDFDNSNTIDSASKELTRSAVIVTLIFLFAFGYDFNYYVLGNIGIITAYKVGTPLQTLGMLLCSVNSAANPFVYAMCMPLYRGNIQSTFCIWCPSAPVTNIVNI